MRGRQPDASSLLHQRRHAQDELGDGVAHVFDLVRANPKRGVRVLADLDERSSTPRLPLGVELFAPNLTFDLTHEGESLEAASALTLDRGPVLPVSGRRKPASGQALRVHVHGDRERVPAHRRGGGAEEAGHP